MNNSYQIIDISTHFILYCIKGTTTEGYKPGHKYIRVVILLLGNAKFAIPKRGKKKFSTTMKKAKT